MNGLLRKSHPRFSRTERIYKGVFGRWGSGNFNKVNLLKYRCYFKNVVISIGKLTANYRIFNKGVNCLTSNLFQLSSIVLPGYYPNFGIAYQHWHHIDGQEIYE